MHETNDQGEMVFRCDFCRMGWSDNRPMVEGHRGALICGSCLAIAYTELVHLRSGYAPDRKEACVLCLENARDELHWASPIDESVIACRRCVKQSAGVLHKDPESPWKKPSDPSDG